MDRFDLNAFSAENQARCETPDRVRVYRAGQRVPLSVERPLPPARGRLLWNVAVRVEWCGATAHVTPLQPLGMAPLFRWVPERRLPGDSDLVMLHGGPTVLHWHPVDLAAALAAVHWGDA